MTKKERERERERETHTHREREREREITVHSDCVFDRRLIEEPREKRLCLPVVCESKRERGSVTEGE